MYSGKGVLRHQDRRIKASFCIDGILCSFSGTISQAAPSFHGAAVSIAYMSMAELTGRRISFEGIIGPNDVRISIGDGVTVSGQLDKPIDSATQISGKCSWVQI
jgi:hypothetical protein